MQKSKKSMSSQKQWLVFWLRNGKEKKGQNVWNIMRVKHRSSRENGKESRIQIIIIKGY